MDGGLENGGGTVKDGTKRFQPASWLGGGGGSLFEVIEAEDCGNWAAEAAGAQRGGCQKGPITGGMRELYRRNLLLLCLVIPACLLAWAAADRSGQGRRFAEVVKTVGQRYIEPVEQERLFQAAMAGVFATLDDESQYVEPHRLESITVPSAQESAGIGVELTVTEASHEVVVLAPVFGGPAWTAGVQPGDRILAIDGEPTRGLLLTDVVSRLRGSPASQLRLKVEQTAAAGSAASLVRELQLTRRAIALESVRGDRRRADGRWEWWLEGEPGLAYIRITQFGERTSDDVAAVLATLMAAGPPQGLIIDLRGNTGGLLDAAVQVCDLLLADGVIVTMNDRRFPHGLTRPQQATSATMLPEVPLAILIDSQTASAAEVVAACLQDHARATVVGSRSYGKGTVQTVVPLPAGQSAIRLTTAEYRRPGGGLLERAAGAGSGEEWGVVPDAGFAFAPTGQQLERWLAWRRRRDRPQQVASDASSRPVADPAAILPRHADPVLARSLAVFSQTASAGRP